MGTLLHSVMEHLDLRGNLEKPGIINTINQMKERKLLTEGEASLAINIFAEKLRLSSRATWAGELFHRKLFTGSLLCF